MYIVASIVIDNLIIYPKNIQSNLNKLKGLHFSQNVMLKLIGKGLLREEAYELVQQNAMKTWKSINSKDSKSFYYNLSNNKKVNSLLKNKELKSIFNNKAYLKNIDIIYKRIFKI